MAWTAASKAARVAAKDAHGNVGRFLDSGQCAKDATRVCLCPTSGFATIAWLGLNVRDRDAYRLPPAMRVASTATGTAERSSLGGW